MSKDIIPVDNSGVTAPGGESLEVKVENFILSVRGVQVMLDRDLARLYGVETKRINEAVKRNKDRFPEGFMFQLSKEEVEGLNYLMQSTDTNLISQNVISRLPSESEDYDENTILRSQFATSRYDRESESYVDNTDLRSQNVTSSWGGLRYQPYVFTEQGVAMLSAVLKSPTAVSMSVKIMNAFVAMRRFLASNAQVFQKLEVIENHQLLLQEHVDEHEKKFGEVFRKLDEMNAQPDREKVFFGGQLFDAHEFVVGLIKKAKRRIVVIDNYLDDTVLTRLAYRKSGVKVQIYTKSISKQFGLDLSLHNSQYPGVTVRTTNKVHDRFVIIDDTVYHLGASIKDLGKKAFAFSKMEMKASELLKGIV